MTKKSEPQGPLWDMLKDLQEYETLEFRLWLWREPPFRPQWQKNKVAKYRFPKTGRHVHLGAHSRLKRHSK